MVKGGPKPASFFEFSSKFCKTAKQIGLNFEGVAILYYDGFKSQKNTVFPRNTELERTFYQFFIFFDTQQLLSTILYTVQVVDENTRSVSFTALDGHYRTGDATRPACACCQTSLAS